MTLLLYMQEVSESQTLRLFEMLLHNKSLSKSNASIVLLLNKLDVFEDKLHHRISSVGEDFSEKVE